jgi:thioredoxin-related protein
MKRNTILFILCLVGSIQNVQANNRLFQTLSIERGQQRAAYEQKLLLVHFSASWCMPSQWMKDNTFSDPGVHQYLRQHYLAIEVDVDLPEGYQEKEQFQVNTLPTLLVFSASGRLLEKTEGIATAEDLLRILAKNNSPRNKWARRILPKDKPTSGIYPRPDFSHLDKPSFALKPQETKATDEQISTPDLPMPVAKPMPQVSTSEEAPVVKLNQKEYGVEVAVLQDYGSVIRYVRNLERRFEQKVYIILEQTPQQKNYHVIMGAYPSRRAAYQLRSHLLDFQIRGSVTALAYAKSR